MSFDRLSYLLLGILCGLSIVSSANGQVTFEDLESGFRENFRQLIDSGIEMEWVAKAELGEQESKPTPEFVAALRSAAKQLSEDDTGGRQLLEMVARRDPAKSLELDYEVKYGHFGLLVTPNGHQFRFIKGKDVDFGVVADSVFLRPNQGLATAITVPKNGEFLSIAISQGDQANYEKTFLINLQRGYKRQHSGLGPLPLELWDSASVQSPIELVYPLVPNDSRLSAEISVQLDGNIAIVEIVEGCKEVLSEDGKYRIGNLVYAEIEIDKGCLPRLIKSNVMAEFDGVALPRPADSYWGYEAKIDNQMLDGRAYYPARISAIHRSVKQEDADYFIKHAQNGGSYDYWTRARHKESIDPELVYERLSERIEVVKINRWAEPAGFFDLELPSDADRIADHKDGRTQVNRSVDSTIALDLQQLERFRSDNLDSSNSGRTEGKQQRTTRLLLWVLFSLASLLALYWANRHRVGSRSEKG